MVTIHFYRQKDKTAGDDRLYSSDRLETWTNAHSSPNIGDIYLYKKTENKTEEELLNEFMDSFKFSDMMIIPCKVVQKTWLDKDTQVISVEEI